MSESAKETVIIVHGTWAAPAPGVIRWYQPADGVPTEGFIARLNAALQRRGSAARCWAHCTEGAKIFYWSGENSWVARTQAAAALGDYVAKLRKEGWCCHIVAHSHGGNVVLEALPQITTAISNASPGKIVTLGTPFMDTMSSILKTMRWKRSVLFAPVVISLGVILLLYHLLLFNDLIDWRTYLLSIIFISLLILLAFWRSFERKNQAAEQVFNEVAPVQPKFLAVGSLMDEAWQILHHMRNASNPMAVRTNLTRYLISSARSRVSRNHQVRALIYGAQVQKLTKWLALVLIMMLSSLLFSLAKYADVIALASFVASIVLLFTSLGIIALILPPIATYVVRSRGWSVVLGIAMGLEGYPYQLPLIEQYPSFLPDNFVKYESMPTGAQQRALAMRGDWIDRHLKNVAQTFSKLIVTSADITLLLRAIEADQTLVHAAYYTDEECIERIADWIAAEGNPGV
jgi:hypothetical protein